MHKIVSLLIFFFYLSPILLLALPPPPKRLPEERRVIALYKNTKDAVVFISTRSFGGDPVAGSSQEVPEEGTGAGVIVDAKQRIILTSLHVINDAATIQIMLSDGKSYSARLVGHDPEYDIAVLQLLDTPEQITAIPFADSTKIEVGQKVFAIGNPHGLERTLTSGIISSLHRTVQNPNNFLMKDLIQTDAAINPGNSGGPLLDLDGNLIGINSAILSQSGDSAGISFAVPIHHISRILPELVATGKVLRPRIGWLLVNTNKGPLVRRVVSGSPANKAGVQPLEREVGKVFKGGYARNFDRADIIYKINDRRVRFVDEVEELVLSFQRGEEFSVTLRQGGLAEKERTVIIKPSLE